MKLVVERSTSRSKEITTTKGKCAKGQGMFNNKKRGHASRKTKRINERSIHVGTKRIGRRGDETMGNLDMVRKRHSSSVCTKRKEPT